MIAIIERTRLLAWALVLVLAVPLPVFAQSPPPAPPAAAPPSGGSEAVFTAEQLEQVAAPIALYPDPLVAQVLMASTYPLEVVQAARFVKSNPKLQGDQLNEKLKDYDWDDSVKSLVQFPQVLDLMNEKLEWTQKLGDAFLAQQKELLDAVQRLRARAQKEGNLKSTNEQKITVEPAPAPPASQTVVVQEQPAQIIKIEPTNPQVVYVPSYNPTVVYGAWPYPAYPPYYPYPPGYAWGAAALSFGVGMAVGAAVWGNTNWGGGNVDVDVNKNANFSRNVNKSDVAAKRTERVQQGQRGSGAGSGGRSQWQHNPEGRKGVQYRDQGTAQKFNRGSSPQASQSREQFRGRADQGRQDLGRGGGQGAGRAQQAGGQGSFGSGGRGGASGGGQGGGAFSGVGGGSDVRGSSSRGQASRESFGGSGSRAAGGSSFSGSSGSRGGSSGFSGGAGSRGGGGGGGGTRGGGGGGGGGGGRGGGRR